MRQVTTKASSSYLKLLFLRQNLALIYYCKSLSIYIFLHPNKLVYILFENSASRFLNKALMVSVLAVRPDKISQEIFPKSCRKISFIFRYHGYKIINFSE